MTVSDFAQNISTLLALHPGSILSWIRSSAWNTEVGGHPRSMHLVGLAVDIVPDPDTNMGDLIIFAERLGLNAINEGGHVHVQIP